MDERFTLMSGTSMASPMAVCQFTLLYGIAKSLYPQETAQALKSKVLDLMCQTAIQSNVSGKSKCGIISLYASAKALFQSF
jgi:hypothetical protein